MKIADVAQSVERILGKDKVTGSIPVISSSFIYGGVAQLARAIGSYPMCPRFKSVRRHHIFFGDSCDGVFFLAETNLYGRIRLGYSMLTEFQQLQRRKCLHGEEEV